MSNVLIDLKLLIGSPRIDFKFKKKVYMKNLVKKNLLKLKPSATLQINEKSKYLIKQGKKVFRFGFGQSPFPIPDDIVSTLKKFSDRKEYLPMQGLPELRKAISEYLTKEQK